MARIEISCRAIDRSGFFSCLRCSTAQRASHSNACCGAAAAMQASEQ